MKIYILPVNQLFQPAGQPFRYPKHNDDFGVEQDFFLFLNNHPDLLVTTPEEADWHYLPVYWTRWHLNHNYGREGLDELQDEVNRLMIADEKTFTICQYDDGPLVNLGKTVTFLASRKSDAGIDIPLLCRPHEEYSIFTKLFKPRKKYLASFMGRLSTHPIRQEMAELLRENQDILILDGDHGPRLFLETMLKSKIALCPRGYGGSSFRFFEAMQLGVVPFLIGDIDTRPFKRFINWNKASLFTSEANEIKTIFLNLNQNSIATMEKEVSQVWKQLKYQNWCSFVLRELMEL